VSAETITLEHLSKRYPGQQAPAVDDLSLTVPAGDIAVLVGPSGCGKTTTMKMINRIIEPTSGRILIGDDDVTRRNPDELRRRIGYVIQQVGLFPHLTVADNVATVPRMLKWPAARVRARVDEMLELVGLEPGVYRDRHPKNLSGGQRQRVGVARALAADPPVMLMDEPFGAIDPVTRERLQNEFLRLQAELRKTIVFVTHDIDEAIKMGDRIAILRDSSHVAQYDTPERILAAPADAFVSEFLGGRTALRRLGLATLRREHLLRWPVLRVGESATVARERLAGSGARAAVVLDETGTAVRWVTADDVVRDGPVDAPGSAAVSTGSTGSTGSTDSTVRTVRLSASLADVLDELLRTEGPGVAVVDRDGQHVGVVDLAAVRTAATSAEGAGTPP
jgi:osmoprotectant transport system ATP-binding protein